MRAHAPGLGGHRHLFAIPFDALDGRIARMTNTTSDFGKELDSLADAITFGVAPSLLALIWGFHFLPDSINPQLHCICTGRRLHLLSVSDRRSFAAGALQHQPRCAAAQSGTAGAQVLCRHADSGGGGPAGCHRALLLRLSGEEWWWIAIPWLVIWWAERLPDGEHLAVLVGQGDQLLPQPSLPVAVCAGDCAYIVLRYSNVVMFPGRLVPTCSRESGRGRRMVVAAAAQKAAERSAH
jgi:hypothetical protein